LSIGEAVKF